MFQWTLPIKHLWFLTLRLLGWTSNSKSVKWNDLPASSSWCSPFCTSPLSLCPPNLFIPKNPTETKWTRFFLHLCHLQPSYLHLLLLAHKWWHIRPGFFRAHPPVFCQEIIAVNQAWAGHSGSPFKQAESYVQLDDFNMQIKGVVLPHQSQVGLGSWGKEAESRKTTGKGAGLVQISG